MIQDETIKAKKKKKINKFGELLNEKIGILLDIIIGAFGGKTILKLLKFFPRRFRST